MLDSRPCVMLTGTDDTVTLVTANLVSGHYCGPAAKFGWERGSYKSLADTLLLTLKHTLSVKTNEGWHLPSLSFSRHRCPVSAHAQAAYMQTKKAAVFNLQKFSVSNFFFYHEIADSVLVSAPPTLCQVAAPKKKKSLSSNSGLLSETAVVESAGKYNICFMVFQLTWGNPARVLSNSVVWLDSSNCSEKCVQGQWIYSTDSMTANEDSNQQDFKPCRILDPMCYHASEPRQWCVRDDTDHLEKLVSVYQKQQSLYNPHTELKLKFFF